jgi:uncharacterized protein YggT (Ycf19 family)
MDVATLQTVSNANSSAYSGMFDSQDDLVGTMSGGGNFMQGVTGGIHGASRGITQLSSGMQELGIISDSQVQDLMMLNAIIGIGYGAMLIYRVLQGVVMSEMAVRVAEAIAETTETLLIPIYGEILVAAAVGAVIVAYAALSPGTSFSLNADISSGTGRRLAASQLGGI